MDFHLPFPATVALIFSMALLASLLQTFNRKSRNNRNPPEAKGAWPVIGHLHLLHRSHLPHKVLGAMADTYGPIFTIKLGVCQALVVSDADMARVCFTTNDLDFANRPTTVVTELLGCNSAKFSFAPYGDYWRKLRKIVTLELLSQRRVEMLGYIRVSELRSATNDIYEAWVMNNSDLVKVEMKQWFGNLILNIVVRSISGKRFSPNDDEGVRFQAVARKYFKLLGAFIVSDFIPFLKGLDVGGYEKAMKVTATEMDNFFDQWLKEKKREKESGGGNQVFMDALLTAGSETTTVTLTWALSLLLNNPKSLKIAQDELDEHVGRERLVEESDIKNLSYLQAIIKETLRLYPPGPLSVPHHSRNDCIVAGYNIAKGTRLFVNLWKLHRDPKVWSDPNLFQPERFLTSKKDIDVKGNHFELLPFGSGRRMCPGVSFALQSLHFTMATLLQQFMLKNPSDEPIDMSESFGMTNLKATPLDVLLTPRLSPCMYHVDA
ncbi:cytochrome P450 [Cynara cardunculus var. scolymus]|uniref:Cytochrome P450 n=1 Tax=Cynara cardunculus var. scolymus TaxID=59895 RepID=A0A103YCJ4_CYNCS|nr:cytochrome P450 [Cynara cardunculus var. scolymus]